MKKKIGKAIAGFIIGFLTAIIVNDKTCMLFTLFKQLKINNVELQNGIISLWSTLIVTIVGEFFQWILKFLSPAKIKIENDNNRINFHVQSDKQYMTKKIEFRCNVIPGGRMSMWLLKKLNATLILSFNPNYIQMTSENDSKWSIDNNDDKEEVSVNNNKLFWSLLTEYDVNVRNLKNYDTSVCLEIVPIVMKKQKTILGYTWNSHFQWIINRLCKVDLCVLECEAENE